MNKCDKPERTLSDLERKKADYEDLARRFGAPWKHLRLEVAIGYISDYEVIASETDGDKKFLTLRKRPEAISKPDRA